MVSHLVVSNSLWLCGLQHARLPSSLIPRACSNSCTSRQWCHPIISSSVILFPSCLQSLPASGFFPRSQFFTSGGQSIGVSASASVLPMTIQNWFPLGLKGLSRVFPNSSKASIIQQSDFFNSPTLTSRHDYWKIHSFDKIDLCQ